MVLNYNRESVPKPHILNIFSNGFHFLKLKILFSHTQKNYFINLLVPSYPTQPTTIQSSTYRWRCCLKHNRVPETCYYLVEKKHCYIYKVILMIGFQNILVYIKYQKIRSPAGSQSKTKTKICEINGKYQVFRDRRKL